MPEKITQKDAVMSAFKYLSEIVSVANQTISEIRIEELELIEGNDFYKVVLSYDVAGQFSFQKVREYKEFKINAENGDVVFMKIKNIN